MEILELLKIPKDSIKINLDKNYIIIENYKMFFYEYEINSGK